MKHSETVTFGGGGLDRAAELRHDSARIAETARQVILLWRGKPALQGDSLLRVGADHPVLRDARPLRVLLGRDRGEPVFAADLSDWEPSGLDGSKLDGFADQTVQQHPDLPNESGFSELRTVMTRLSPMDAELAATARAIQGWHDSHRFCSKCGAETVFAMGGFQRDCHACGAHHFPRTDPVVIMLITRANTVLMGRSPGWPPGMYSLLAGFVEPGETIEAAVRREVFEEAGIRVGAVSYLASQPWPFPASLMFGCRGEALDDAITIDPAEIEDARWITREEMVAVFGGHHPDILPARKGAIAHFLLENWLADRLD